MCLERLPIGSTRVSVCGSPQMRWRLRSRWPYGGAAGRARPLCLGAQGTITPTRAQPPRCGPRNGSIRIECGGLGAGPGWWGPVGGCGARGRTAGGDQGLAGPRRGTRRPARIFCTPPPPPRTANYVACVREIVRPGPWGAATFQEVSEAYEHLSDPDRQREWVDLFREREGIRPAPHRPPPRCTPYMSEGGRGGGWDVPTKHKGNPSRNV